MSKDVIWTFTIQMAIMICAFAITKILSNRLSIDDFGQYNLIKRSVQVLSFVMLGGVGIALPRYISLYQNGNYRKPIFPLLTASLIYIIGITIFVCIICELIGDNLQFIILGENSDNTLLLIALAYAFVSAMSQFTYAYYRGTGDIKEYNGTQLAIQLAMILPLIILPTLTTSNVFISWLIVTTILVVAFLGRETILHTIPRVSVSNIKTELRTIIKYSTGRLLADLFLFSLSAFPLIFISNTHGFQQTAYYSVGITFVTMVTPLFSFMGIILLPYVAESIAKRQLQKASQFINKLALIYLVSALVFTAIIYVFISFLTSLFFADNYLVTTELSRIIILAVLPQAIYLLYRNPIDAISVIPYNTIILGVSLVTMILAFKLSTTLNQFAWAYVIVSMLQGGLSMITWYFIKQPYKA